MTPKGVCQNLVLGLTVSFSKSKKLKTQVALVVLVRATIFCQEAKMSSAPMYRIPMTAAQMAEESRKATAEGMRQIAAALAERKVQHSSPLSVSDDSDSGSEDGRRNRRKRHTPSESDFKVRQLESRTHILGVELAAAKVEVDDMRQERDTLKGQIEVFGRINNELALLKSATGRVMKGTETLSLNQLVQRSRLFKEEMTEHAALCYAALGRITQDEIRSGITRVIESEKRKAATLSSSLGWVIWRNQAYVFGMSGALICSLALLLAMWLGRYL